MMQISRQLLTKAVDDQILEQQQADNLWQFLQQNTEHTASFRSAHILYYCGGLLAISAMSLFITLAWQSLGGWGLLFIALAYAGLCLFLTEYFIHKKALLIPAGIMASLVVVLTPLAVYGLQLALGFWQGYAYRDYHVYIDWRWLLMELATLISASIMLWRYRLPFLVMPLAATLWYLSMDVSLFIFHGQDYNWELRRLTSLFFGLLMLLLGFWVDIRSRKSEDYAFWLYLFGLITFWGSLMWFYSESEWHKFVYFSVNVVLIFVGMLLTRRMFVLFGAMGLFIYISHLAYNIFANSLGFPVVLSLIGFVIIYLGIVWQKHEQHIAEKLKTLLPKPLQQLVEKGQ